MKNELTCAVVRDLLPSFVEGLTAPETNEAVLAHLTGVSGLRRPAGGAVRPGGWEAERRRWTI